MEKARLYGGDSDWPRSPWLITVSSETKGAVNVCVPVLA